MANARSGNNSHTGHSVVMEPRSIERLSGFILFMFALIFRLIYVIQSNENPLFGVPVVDASSYVKWANKMVDGVWLWDSVGNYLPIYSAFLALQQLVFGPGPIVNKILQSIMGAGTAVLLAQVAGRLWNRQVGLIGGYLLATYWMLVIFESEKYAETFSIFFLSLTLFLLTHYSKRNWAIVAAGFALALCAGVRANLFLVLPCIIAWLIWHNRSHPRSAIQSALLFTCGTIFIIGPILARNYYLVGAPMLRAQATWSLYSGLAPEFKGLHPPAGILFDKYMNLATQAGALTVPEIEKFWAHKLWEVIKEDPAGVIVNFGRRIMIFVNAREWSQEFDVYAYRNYSRFLRLPWTGFWLVGPLGILGLLLCRRPTRDQALLIIVTIATIISIIPFKASDRYRLPAAVLLTLFAAMSLWIIFTTLKNREKRGIYKTVLPLTILCLICWPDWQHLGARKSARHLFFVGKHYESTGRLQEAAASYRKSMAEYPWDADSPHRLGLILARQGQNQQAVAYLHRALQREPDFPAVLTELARHHMRADELSPAEKLLTASLKLEPNREDSLILMSKLLGRKNGPRSEIEFLKEAVSKTHRHRPAMMLADRLLAAGNYIDAAGLYELVMRSRQVDKFVRVTAAMMAGITTARYLKDAADEKIFWRYVADNFDDFKFFSLQAKYLNGTLTQKELRLQMDDSPVRRISTEYIIGLKYWLDGDIASAAKAFERCLQIESEDNSGSIYLPLKWAREDLARIQDANAASQIPKKD